MISFQGLDADRHIIEAYSGTESAAGIARVLTLITHFAATGTVRQRFPFSDSAQVYLKGTEDGSFNWKMVATVSGALALGVSGNALYDLTKAVISSALGEHYKTSNSEVSEVVYRKLGDFDALVEAVEPALKKAHYGVGQTASRIVIREKNEREVVIELNEKSKSYLTDSVNGGSSEQDVSIS